VPTPKPTPAAKAVPTPKPTPAAKAVPTPKPTAAKAPATAAKPSGTLTVGQKELGVFQGHPKLAVNPALFLQQTAPVSEGLITINVDKQVQGSLAKSWDISPDFKTWTFYLQEGVQFHKGYGEMTAEDVIWSYRDGWAGNPRHARTPDFIAFWRPRGGKVTAVDKYTVEVHGRSQHRNSSPRVGGAGELAGKNPFWLLQLGDQQEAVRRNRNGGGQPGHRRHGALGDGGAP